MPNLRGTHPGIFAMLRGLRLSGRLSDADAELAEGFVGRSYALHDEPPASVFETEPRALSWFIEDDGPAAADLLDLALDVTALLERYGIHTQDVRCAHPGRVTYQDAVQVVAVPWTAADWPF
ncbi:hypothetical protein [Ornithinimicrobium faecis]|uniref:hypothetical protein n=1 Tax=Ornithinimicrobium faecis TaxID=2934158 RepID=UPI002118078C|nr:hypothetical protein [Ornithinimicrobium sp. HY1745]